MTTISIDQTKSRAVMVDYVGDDIKIKIRYPHKGDMFDMTGSMARFFLKDTIGEIVFDVHDGDGIQFADFGSHNIEITISRDATIELGDGRFKGFFVLTDSLGHVDTKFELALRLVAQ